jgi:hypothetical protein
MFMRAIGRGLKFLGAVALSMACAGKTPTGPVIADLEGASSQPASSPVRGSAPRSLAPRQLAADGLIGTWGGDHVRATVGLASTVLVYDCANGSIDQPFTVDAAGRFVLTGTHVMESGGPVRAGDEPVRHPARYTGSTDGKVLTFTVTLTDTTQTFGPFTLALNAPGRVVRCL